MSQDYWLLNGNVATPSPTVSVCLLQTALAVRCPRSGGVLCHCVVSLPSCPMFKTTAAALKLSTVWAKRAQWSKMQKNHMFPMFAFLLCVGVCACLCFYYTFSFDTALYVGFYGFYVPIAWWRMICVSCVCHRRFSSFNVDEFCFCGECGRIGQCCLWVGQ